MKTYADIRSTIKTGDIILCSGNSPIDTGIKSVTHSEYTHVALARVDHGRVMVFEASAYGVVYQPMSMLRKRGYQFLTVFRLKKEYTDSSLYSEDRLVGTALDELGKNYAYSQIGKIWWVERFGWPKHPINANHDAAYICSGYVSKCLNSAGFDPSIKMDNFTYPSDYEKWPLLDKLDSFSF